jgi:hypothetical protein
LHVTDLNLKTRIYEASQDFTLGVNHVRRQISICAIMEHLPIHTFRRIVKRYDEDHKVQTFSCLDKFFCKAFAQLTIEKASIYRDLRAQHPELYPLGTRSKQLARNRSFVR